MMSSEICKLYTVHIPPGMAVVFNRGEVVEIRVYHKWILEVGDKLRWQSHESVGFAEVVALRGPKGNRWATIKKTI